MNTPANDSKSAKSLTPEQQTNKQASNVSKTAQIAQKETAKTADSAAKETQKTQKKAASTAEKSVKKASKSTKKNTNTATKAANKTTKKATQTASKTAKKNTKSASQTAKKNTKTVAKQAKKNTNKASKASRKTASKTVSKTASQAKKTISQTNQWMQGIENSASYMGKENIDFVMQSGSTISKNIENLSKLLIANAQNQVQDSISTSQQMLSCRSLEEVSNLQQSYIVGTMNRMQNQAKQINKMTEDITKQATGPIGSQMNQIIKSMTNWAA